MSYLQSTNLNPNVYFTITAKQHLGTTTTSENATKFTQDSDGYLMVDGKYVNIDDSGDFSFATVIDYNHTLKLTKEGYVAYCTDCPASSYGVKWLQFDSPSFIWANGQPSYDKATKCQLVTPGPSSSSSSMTWLWITLPIVILILIILTYFLLKNKKSVSK